MASIVDRNGKGSALTHAQVDANFDSLNGINEVVVANLTVDYDDQNKTLECTGAAGVITLPEIAVAVAAGDTTDFGLTIVNAGTGTTTINTNAADTLNDGSTTAIVLLAGESVTLQSGNTATEWNHIATNCLTLLGLPSKSVLNKLPVWLETQTYTAGQATIDFDTNFDSTYDHYYIECSKIWPSVDADEVYMYVYAGGAWQATNDYAVNGAALANQIEIITNLKAEGPTGYGAGRGRVDIYMYDAAVTAYAAIDARMNFPASGSVLSTQNTAATYLTAEAISGVRFKASTGNIEGEFRLYGIPK